MSQFLEIIKPISTLVWRTLKIIFICFRCLLWSVFFWVIIFSSDYFTKDHLDLLWVLLVFISIPVTLVLICKQFVSDIKYLRNRYSANLFKESYNELGGINTIVPFLDKGNALTYESKELCWNVSTGDEFRNLDSYLSFFVERRDYHAKQMRRAISKNDMKSLIMNAPNSIHSIRIWESEGLLSIDYANPITVQAIEGFSISKETTVIRGEAVTKRVTKYKGYSYPSFFMGKRNYRWKKTSTYRTTYQPDRVVNDYEVSIIISQPNYEVIRMNIKNNRDIADRITKELRELGIKQIY